MLKRTGCMTTMTVYEVCLLSRRGSVYEMGMSSGGEKRDGKRNGVSMAPTAES